MITSKQNPRIKNIVKLGKATGRKEQNLFVIEGFREITRAMDAGIRFTLFLGCPEIARMEELNTMTRKMAGRCEIETVSCEVFEKIAYREGSDGMLALARPEYLRLEDIRCSSAPLLIILEAVEKPGNLGAVLRTADAAGVDAVIITNPHTELYNPNVIRSSIGCVFTVPVIICETAEAVAWLKDKGIVSFATSLEASTDYTHCDFTKPAAIVMGTEATGLSGEWLQHADHRIIIPMRGVADSLNVSTAAAIVVFEAIRQRKLPK